MAEIKHIDTNKSGPVCMHCGKWVGLEYYTNGNIAYGIFVGKRKIGSYIDEDDHNMKIDVITETLDNYIFCKECFAEIDVFFNDFILYPRVNHFVIKKEG